MSTWEETMLESQRGYVERQLDAGVAPDTVAADLERMGVDVARARQFVASFGARASYGTLAVPQLAFASPQPALAYGIAQPPPVYGRGTAPHVARQRSGNPAPGGVVGAGVGTGIGIGLVMGAIAMMIDLKYGLMACPIGGMVGLAIRRAGGRGSADVLLVAFVGTALGVAVERFLATVQAVHDIGPAIHRLAQANHVPVTTSFSRSALLSNPTMYSAFLQNIGSAFGIAGFLSLLLGLFLAARIVMVD